MIQLHLEGKSRNEIAQILNSSHIRISQGSVTNILRRKRGNSAPSQHPETRPQEVSPRPPSPVPLRLENVKGQEHVPGCAKGPIPEEAQKLQVQSSGNESFMDSWWSMVFGQVMEIKKQRRELDQKKNELERVQIKLLEAEPFIPIARQLQQMGTDINQFLPWVETVHEKAQTEKMDLRAAAYNVAQDIRSYRQLGSLQEGIEQAQQRLALLNMFTVQKERALMVLMELQNRGVSLDEIYGLSKILDLDKLGKEWHYGTGQDNGSGNGVNGFHNLPDRLNCVTSSHIRMVFPTT